MASTTFGGPIRVGKKDVSVGTLQASRSQVVVPLAQANTDVAFVAPKGWLLRVTAITDVAFSGTTATLQGGSTVGGTDFFAATSVKSAGGAAMPMTAAMVAAAAAADTYTVNLRLVQTGATNVGSCRLHVEYVPVLLDAA